jgi:hypothetical protein
MSKLEIWQFIKMGAQKTQSFGSGMNGQGLNSSVLKKPWGRF